MRYCINVSGWRAVPKGRHSFHFSNRVKSRDKVIFLFRKLYFIFIFIRNSNSNLSCSLLALLPTRAVFLNKGFILNLGARSSKFQSYLWRLFVYKFKLFAEVFKYVKYIGSTIVFHTMYTHLMTVVSKLLIHFLLENYNLYAARMNCAI